MKLPSTPQSEAEITRAIKATLKGLSIWHWKHYQGTLTPLKGISDILGIYKGKRADSHMADRLFVKWQKEWLESIRLIIIAEERPLNKLEALFKICFLDAFEEGYKAGKENRGKFLAIEVKNAKGRLSSHQEAFLNRVNEEGGIAFVARSVDDVIDNLGLRDRFCPIQKNNKRR
jgi:hypothetical protein